jgi:DNA-binding response OmpR family regulator
VTGLDAGADDYLVKPFAFAENVLDNAIKFTPEGGDYRVYKVVAGKRTHLETREGLKVPAGEWHTLKVRQVGDRIECSLDGRK